jgi:hypothetical protein
MPIENFPLPYVLVDSEDGKTYRTGRILSQVHPDNFLVQFDTVNGSGIPPLPITMVHINEMNSVTDDDFKAWSFFATVQERQAWMDWCDGPSKPQVVSLVKK